MTTAAIYFNIVPKGNVDLSLYFENKNSTLKLHKDKSTDNAQWQVKWLGAENGKDLVVLINKGLGLAMKAQELKQASSVIPSEYGKDTQWLLGDIKEGTFRGILPKNNSALNLNAWEGGQLYDGQDVRLYPYTETYNDLWEFRLVN